MEAERAAAAAIGAPMAPRPDHWVPARDVSAIAEYVTLDLSSQGHTGEEVETIMKAVERCHQVPTLYSISHVQHCRPLQS